MNNDFINNSNYYIPEDIPRKRKKKKKIKAKKIRRQNPFLVILSVLISLVLTVNLICAILLTSVGGILRTNNIDKLLTSVLNDVDISELEIPTKNGSQTLSAMILDLASGYRGFQGITEENIDFDKLEDFAKLFLVEMIDNSNVAKEGITGIGITPEQIYDFIESNEDTIVDLLRSSGYDGNIPIRENKEPLIKELKKKIGNDGINVAKLLDQIDKTGKINVYVPLVESVFSITSIFLAWLIVGLLALLLLPVNIKFFGAYLRSLGIPMILAGATVSVSTLAGSLLIELLPIDKDSIKLIVSSVINGISKQINELSITILIIGVMITTLSIVVSIIQRKQNA